MVFDKLKRSQFDKNKLKSRLKMAQTRINLLRNKTTNSIKIQKRQVANLLQSEKDESARIKVENIIRDDYVLEALDILQLFCDLVLTRVALIAESKDCPHDMKESISTLIYAAPRVQIDELMEIREQFKAKFGKDFVQKAMDNKDLAVNQRVMFKLGLKVPKPYLCIQYLKKIAEEYNIDWEDEDEEQPQEILRDQLQNPEMGYPSNTEGTGYEVDFNPNMNLQQPAYTPPLQQNQSNNTYQNNVLGGTNGTNSGGVHSYVPQVPQPHQPPQYSPSSPQFHAQQQQQFKAQSQKRQETFSAAPSEFDLQQQQFNQMFNSSSSEQQNLPPPIEPYPSQQITSSQMDVEDDLQRRLRELSAPSAGVGNNNNEDDEGTGNGGDDLSYDFNALQRRFEMLKKRD
eukprot:CAMPEP_0117451008 /NCGR_PEP_ID=MMETSP0759-20121206/8776_1 /TAXON_ID=63605 /ORGANISM="Percolomonas cosmopolitus, Strain WS" /LENGTH=399 /DNA_ID=CAMNT_0005243575 /DNA_START=99 /DNA_END=1298 /DNA_ORIENTATION=+